MTKIINNDNMTISDYLKSQHMAAEFFTVSAPGRWQSKLMNAEHWKEDYNITTVEQLKEYLDECSRPSLADQMYYFYQEMEQRWKEEEIAEDERLKKAVKEMSSKGPLTHNPFAVFFTTKEINDV